MPSLLKKRKDLLQLLVESIFSVMTSIKEEITEEWKCPPEGYNDEDTIDEYL